MHAVCVFLCWRTDDEDDGAPAWKRARRNSSEHCGEADSDDDEAGCVGAVRVHAVEPQSVHRRVTPSPSNVTGALVGAVAAVVC